jgi:hypothetical protein
LTTTIGPNASAGVAQDDHQRHVKATEAVKHSQDLIKRKAFQRLHLLYNIGAIVARSVISDVMPTFQLY